MEFCSENLETIQETTTTEGIINEQEGIIIESEEATESRVTASVSTSESLKGELRRLQPQNNKQTNKKSETQDFNKQHTKHTSQLRRKPTSSRRVVVKKRNRGNKIKSFQMKFLPPFVASLIPCWTLLPLQHQTITNTNSRLNSLYPKIPKNSPRPSRVFKKEL